MENFDERGYKYAVIEFAARAAKLMLENGGETYRAEDITARITSSGGYPQAGAYVTPTVIMVNSNDEDAISFHLRIQERGTNLEKVKLLNDTVREFTSGDIKIPEAYKKLDEIAGHKNYSMPANIIFAGIVGGSFAVIFKGGLCEFLTAFMTALVAEYAFVKVSFFSKTNYLAYIISSLCIGFFAKLFALVFLPSSVHTVISGAMMPILPGAVLTNGVRDLINGDLLSGVSRLFEALIIGSFIAFGVGFGMTIWRLFV